VSTDTLPDGWNRVKFGDVASRVNESVTPTPAQSRLYIGLEHMRTDSYTITEWGSEVDLDVAKTPVLRGDVLFARRNTHLRRCAVAPFDTIFSPDGYAIRTKDPTALLQAFLLYVVASDGFMGFAVENSAGTHSKRVKWSALEQYEFALPPVDEQRRIASLLGDSDSLIVAAVEAESVARASLVDLAIRLTTTETAPRRPLGEVVEILNTQRVPVNDAERSKRKGDVPYYGANGQVGTIDAALFNEPLVLLAEDGGRFSEWRSSSVAYRIDGPSWVNNHAHVLRATGIPLGWLYFSLRNMDLTKLIVGTTRTKLNRGALDRITLTIPEDLESRLRVLEGTERLVDAASKYVATCRSLAVRLREVLLREGNGADV